MYMWGLRFRFLFVQEVAHTEMLISWVCGQILKDLHTSERLLTHIYPKDFSAYAELHVDGWVQNNYQMKV